MVFAARFRKCEAVALFEGVNFVDRFRAFITDFQQVRFKQGNCIGQKFRQWAVKIIAQRGIHGVLKDVRQAWKRFLQNPEIRN